MFNCHTFRYKCHSTSILTLANIKYDLFMIQSYPYHSIIKSFPLKHLFIRNIPMFPDEYSVEWRLQTWNGDR